MENSAFLVSAVTATRNRAALLPRCLDSVAAQTYPHKEHVVIDGASTDGTPQLLKEYGRIRPYCVWVSEPDRGLSDAFNKGLALASGDCIGVIGDDDWYEPGAFEIVAELFARNPQAGLVAGACNFVRSDGSLLWTQPARFSNRRDLVECWKHWGRAVSIPAPSTWIRREVIEAVGGFDERDKFAMDYRHWIKITERFSVVTTDAVLANFRYDAGTISHSQSRRQRAETFRISREYWGAPRSREYLRFWFSFLRFSLLEMAKTPVRGVRARIGKNVGSGKADGAN